VDCSGTLPTIKSVRVGPRTYKGKERFRQVHTSV
jgi:hypothetical protein